MQWFSSGGDNQLMEGLSIAIISLAGFFTAHSYDESQISVPAMDVVCSYKPWKVIRSFAVAVEDDVIKGC
jgi:hypothetical protein